MSLIYDIDYSCVSWLKLNQTSFPTINELFFVQKTPIPNDKRVSILYLLLIGSSSLFLDFYLHFLIPISLLELLNLKTRARNQLIAAELVLYFMHNSYYKTEDL